MTGNITESVYPLTHIPVPYIIARPIQASVYIYTQAYSNKMVSLLQSTGDTSCVHGTRGGMYTFLDYAVPFTAN